MSGLDQMKVVTFCPLMKTERACEYVDERNGEQVIVRCRLFKHLRGIHPQTGQEIDESDCSIGWGPLLLTEVARTNRGQTRAIEALRDVVSDTQEEMNLLEEQHLQIPHGHDD